MARSCSFSSPENFLVLNPDMARGKRRARDGRKKWASKKVEFGGWETDAAARRSSHCSLSALKPVDALDLGHVGPIYFSFRPNSSRIPSGSGWSRTPGRASIQPNTLVNASRRPCTSRLPRMVREGHWSPSWRDHQTRKHRPKENPSRSGQGSR